MKAVSKVFLHRLGEQGRHARSAFAPSRLSLDAPVELAVTFAVGPVRP